MLGVVSAETAKTLRDIKRVGTDITRTMIFFNDIKDQTDSSSLKIVNPS